MSGQLGNFRTNKVLTVLEFTKQKVQFKRVENPKDKEMMAKNPLCKFPFMEVPEEGLLNSSNSIVRYLAASAKKLYGDNAFQQGQIDAWMDFSAMELEPVLALLVLPVFGQFPYDQAKHNRALNDAKALF